MRLPWKHFVVFTVYVLLGGLLMITSNEKMVLLKYPMAE